MTEALSRQQNRPALLLLVSLFLLWNISLASLAAVQRHQVIIADLMTLMAWKAAFFFGLCLCLNWVLRDLRQTLLGVSLFVAFWLMGGPLVAAILMQAKLEIVTRLILIGTTGFIVAFAINRYFELFSRFVAVFAAIVFSMQLPGLYAVFSHQNIEDALNGFEVELPTQPDQAQPHIIYIVPDRYASNSNLRALYGFSNAPFTSALKSRGFHVWDDQNANYPKTFMSLASTLNAEYLDPVLEDIPETGSSHSFMAPLIRNSAARRALQARGYAYTHIGAWWGPTKSNPWADQNFQDTTLPFNETTSAYLEGTPLSAFLRFAEAQKTPCDIIDEKFELIHQQVQAQTPQFIFWHSLITHDPYVYAADGSCRGRDTDRYFISDHDARNAVYLEHIGHFNRRTIALIDSVFQDASRDVIIVIQSDEGPFPEDYLLAENAADRSPYNFLETSRREMKRKHGIFNAIYLPSQDYKDAQELKTPVNNFRLIFRELTGQSIPLLLDRSYTFEFDDKPYVLHDISDELHQSD